MPSNLLLTIDGPMLVRFRRMKQFQGCSLGIGAHVCADHLEAFKDKFDAPSLDELKKEDVDEVT
jgi:hypothetical protein